MPAYLLVAALAAVPSLTFTELRDALEMTDGNLSVHLQKLEERGYVAIDNTTLKNSSEDRLVRSGALPYLVQIWSDAHWRLFRVSPYWHWCGA